MLPAARIASAIEILDQIISGDPAEKVLTNWARSHRFAGSGDRAAIRDHVFDALRCRRSYGHLGGGDTGRALMIGAQRAAKRSVEDVFSGQGYAPSELTAEESDFTPQPIENTVLLDCPEWIYPLFQASLGAKADAVLEAMKTRAPLFLRVNIARATVEAAIDALAAEGIETRTSELSVTAIEVLTNPRKVQNSNAFKDGLVEIQDAASQAVVDMLPVSDGDAILDYCAGGGGKSLAIAARADVNVTAHDALPGRMADLPERAKRANATINVADEDGFNPAGYDLVLCDVPCSGTGAWRRSPAAKWTFDQKALDVLIQTQQGILRQVVDYVKPGGTLAYVTCSMLDIENQRQIEMFLNEHPQWKQVKNRQLTPLDGGDGFYIALLTRV